MTRAGSQVRSQVLRVTWSEGRNEGKKRTKQKISAKMRQPAKQSRNPKMLVKKTLFRRRGTVLRKKKKHSRRTTILRQNLKMKGKHKQKH